MILVEVDLDASCRVLNGIDMQVEMICRLCLRWIRRQEYKILCRLIIG